METFNSRLENYRHTIGKWWLLLLLGIAIFAVGILIFRYPGETYSALSVTFGILILISGIIQSYIGFKLPVGTGRGWMMAAGIIEIIIGLILTFNLHISAAVLPFFLGFWLLFRGISLIGVASDMREAGIQGTGWTIFWAVLLILSAIMVLIFPAIGAGAIVIWIGISFLFGGISLIFFSFHLRSLLKRLG